MQSDILCFLLLYIKLFVFIETYLYWHISVDQEENSEDNDDRKGIQDLDSTDLYLIFQYLPWRARKRMRLVCRLYNQIITQMDKRFSVLTVDLSKGKFIDHHFLKSSSLDICVKLPIDKDLEEKLKAAARGMEIAEVRKNRPILFSEGTQKMRERGTRDMAWHGARLSKVVNFIIEFKDRIVGVEAACRADLVLASIAILGLKLKKLKKIKLHNHHYSEMNSELLSDIISNNAATIEVLNLYNAKLDVIEVKLPNLKILHLEQVSGERGLASILNSKSAPKLETVDLWNVHLTGKLETPLNSVRVMSLSSCRGVAAIHSLITHSSQCLTKLELNFVDFNDDSQISAMPNLKDLSIMSCTGSSYLSTLLNACATSLATLSLRSVDMSVVVNLPILDLSKVKLDIYNVHTA